MREGNGRWIEIRDYWKGECLLPAVTDVDFYVVFLAQHLTGDGGFPYTLTGDGASLVIASHGGHGIIVGVPFHIRIGYGIIVGPNVQGEICAVANCFRKFDDTGICVPKF